MDIVRLICGVVEEGLLYAIVSLGVYITYRILDFPDMTVDGSFPFGAAVTAVLIKMHILPILILPICFALGLIVGAVTGVVHIKLKVRDLLSGIIVMTALYSVNLRIVGRANLPVFKEESIFRNNIFISGRPGEILPKHLHPFFSLIVLLVIVIICKLILDYYFQTKNGYLLKAVGNNEKLVTSLARNSGNVKILGLAIANGFVALAGSVYCQHKGFFEISIGTGTVVIALANVIIGAKLFKNSKIIKPTTAVIIGSIIYRCCVSIAIQLGLPSSDLKLITAALLLLVLVLNKKEKKRLL